MIAPLRFVPKLLLVLLLIGKSSTPGVAQDVFGGTSTPEISSGVVTETPAKKENDLSVTENSAVVRSLRSAPPQTPADLARAIQLMTRVSRWDQVNYWLEQAQKMGINEANAYAMVQEVGTQPFLELVLRGTEIEEPNREAVKRILDLANAKMKSADRLKALVRELYSPSKKDRINAFLSLQSAGNRAVKALIDEVLTAPTIPNETMSEALALLSKPSYAAWRAAMMSPNPSARGRLALLAARIGEPSLAIELCTVANDGRIDENVRQELHAIAARRNKKIPSGLATFRIAIDKLNDTLKDYRRVRWNDDADAFIQWKIASDGNSVIDSPAREADLVWNRAVQFANCAVYCNLVSDVDSATSVAVLLEAQGRVAVDMSGIEPVKELLSPSIRDSFEFACLIWDASVQQDLSSAQLHAVQHLAQWATTGTMPGPVRERLSKAARSGYPPVRYEAALTLLRSLYEKVNIPDATPKLVSSSFDGKSHVEKTVNEMMRLDGQPLALIIGGNSELRTHTRELLHPFSYRTIEAASANATMSILRESHPIEAIFIVEKVLEMDLGQLADRIHSVPTTSTCPIAVLAASLSIAEHGILDRDPRVFLGSVPPESGDFAEILRRMNILSQSPKIEFVQRIQWKEAAQELATDSFSGAPESALKPDFVPQIQTPVGQKYLISVVLDKSLPMSKREQASKIFVQSVKQFGLQISSETADAQYDVYNTRGPAEVELRVILGRVLDAIEAGKGDKPWSEVTP